MAYQEQTSTRTYFTSGAVNQYEFVTLPDSSNRVGRAGAGARSSGVAIQSATGASQAIGVAYDGRVKVLAGATIAAGATIMSNASGRAVPSTATNTILGVALEAAVAGQVITIRLGRSERVA